MKTLETSAAVGFTKTLRIPTPAETARLPTYSAFVSQPPPYDSPHYQQVSIQLTVINNSGTVVGSLATDVYCGGVPESTEVGYLVTMPDGRFSGFRPLANGSMSTFMPREILSQANQVLVFDMNGAKLFEVNTGTTTSVTQLVPPKLLKRFGSLNVDDIDDRGDVLIDGSDWKGTEYYILTPPGLPPPAVPEPSSLLNFAAVGALVARAVRRRPAASCLIRSPEFVLIASGASHPVFFSNRLLPRGGG